MGHSAKRTGKYCTGIDHTGVLLILVNVKGYSILHPTHWNWYCKVVKSITLVQTSLQPTPCGLRQTAISFCTHCYPCSMDIKIQSYLTGLVNQLQKWDCQRHVALLVMHHLSMPVTQTCPIGLPLDANVDTLEQTILYSFATACIYRFRVLYWSHATCYEYMQSTITVNPVSFFQVPNLAFPHILVSFFLYQGNFPVMYDLGRYSTRCKLNQTYKQSCWGWSGGKPLLQFYINC